EPVRDRAPFVTQRVESGGQHERFRQARQTACKQRRCPPVLPVLAAGEIATAEELDGLAREEVALAVRPVRLESAALVGGGIDEELESERRCAAVAGVKGDHGSEIAAGTVASYGDATLVDGELGSLPGDPRSGDDAIVERRGKRVLGREPIVDREHGAARAIRELPAERIVRVDVADRPAAAMEVHER